MSPTRRELLALFALMASAMPAFGGDSSLGGGEADEKEGTLDHDDARDALKRGDVISLHEALEIIDGVDRGHVIDIALTNGPSGYVYTFKLKTKSGHVVTLRMNAHTGQLIDTSGS